MSRKKKKVGGANQHTKDCGKGKGRKIVEGERGERPMKERVRTGQTDEFRVKEDAAFKKEVGTRGDGEGRERETEEEEGKRETEERGIGRKGRW